MESDAAEMQLNGTPEEYAECMALIEGWQAERKGTVTQVYGSSLRDARAQLATEKARAGIEGPLSRALATSEARKKASDVFEWASYCMVHKSKISLAEWRAQQC